MGNTEGSPVEKKPMYNGDEIVIYAEVFYNDIDPRAYKCNIPYMSMQILFGDRIHNVAKFVRFLGGSDKWESNDGRFDDFIESGGGKALLSFLSDYCEAENGLIVQSSFCMNTSHDLLKPLNDYIRNGFKVIEDKKGIDNSSEDDYNDYDIFDDSDVLADADDVLGYDE